MPADVTIPLATVLSFLLALARVSATFVFVPLPGIRNGPEPVRAILSIAITFALFSQWPKVDASEATLGRMTGWLLSEAVLGLSVGIVVAIVAECFQMAAQIVGMQAGYSYASTIDPSTQSDSGVLLVFAQLTCGLLFFALGLDREVVRIFAANLASVTTDSFVPGRPAVDALLQLAGRIFSTGLRIAMPAVALLLAVDIGLALVGRMNVQLQLLTLAFPVKMLAALALLTWVAVLFPTLFRGAAREALAAVPAVLGR